MVVTKVIQIKSSKNLKRAINYITRDDATLIHDNGSQKEEDVFSYELVNNQVMKRLVAGHHLTDISDVDMIYEDFILLKQSVDAFYDNEVLSDLKNDNRVLAHHVIQSFFARRSSHTRTSERNWSKDSFRINGRSLSICHCHTR